MYTNFNSFLKYIIRNNALLCYATTILLIALKLSGTITASWIVIFSPIYFVAGLITFLIMGYFTYLVLVGIILLISNEIRKIMATKKCLNSLEELRNLTSQLENLEKQKKS